MAGHYLPNHEADPIARPVISENPSVAEKGNEAQLWELPVGPAWEHAHPANAGSITNLNEFPVPPLVLSALVSHGFLRNESRSDREEIKNGIRRALNHVLKEHMIAAMNRDALLRSQAEQSWGAGRR